MGISSRVKDKYIARLDELIQAGCGIPMTQHSAFVSSNILTGEVKYRKYNLASWPEFVEWRTSCIAILDQAVPKSSLLRKTVDSFDTIRNEPSKLEFAVSFLKSVRAELQNGFLDDLALQIESEVLTDYLAQAAGLLSDVKDEPSYIPAAILVGALLEKTLRTLCAGLIPAEPVINDKDVPLRMNALIDALKKRQVFNELQAKQLRAWSAIRNSAAHGNFQEFNRHQVEMMLEGVRAFIAQHVR